MTANNETLRQFQVTIEIHGRGYTLTRSAENYIQLVREINYEFGNVMILKTIDLD